MIEDQGASRGLSLTASGTGLDQRGAPGLVAVRTPSGLEPLSGVGEWAVPDGVDEIEVTVIGAGGGAGANEGGGPGRFRQHTFKVRPGDRFKYSVGEGGLPGEDGGASWFNRID